ncbi:MAG TPA: MarC family protein [bacterium]|nr:MarC family protein [bacterium]
MTFAQLLSLFLPIFVAMDAVGVLPSFVQMTSGMRDRDRRDLLRYSVLTAGLVGLLFIPLGPWVLSALGLKPGDFQVAGGLLILVVALRDIVWDQKMSLGAGAKGSGVVPLGIPLLVGPAVLTTLVLLLGRFSDLEVAAALAVNLLLAWLVFGYAARLIRWMGEPGARVASKLAALLLSAYAVMMIRVGLSSLK